VPLYEIIEDLELDAPVAVLALDGWIDAGGGAQRAREALLGSLETTTVATFDTDTLLDFRSRRPSMHLDAGVLTGLTWPSIELRAATDFDGNDLLFLVGAEPDHQWPSFCGDVADLLVRYDARMVVGLGAYPAAVPHTRPTRLASAASDERLARFASVRSSVEVPTGVQGAIERRAAEHGLAAIGLWAQVPHYVSAMPSPAAAAALVDGLAGVADIAVPSDDLHREAQALRSRLDDLVAGNPEHVRMVHDLEEQWDEEESGTPSAGPRGDDPAAPPMNMVSGDEIAAEFERFLREQGDT
jgi:proteasome assembly chaperone (PAC2) family protein